MWYNVTHSGEEVNPDLFDDVDPFEIDEQEPHLFKHGGLGVDDVYDVWTCDPLFYPADPRGGAKLLMVAEVPGGDVLCVPLAKSASGRVDKCRPIGVYLASWELAQQYRADR